MRLSRLPDCPAFLACLAAALLLCACGSSSPSSSSSSLSSSSSSSSSGPSASGCPYSSDSLTAVQPSVQASAPQSSVNQTVSPGKHERLACGTTVTVAGPSGTAIARFGSQEKCQLQPFDGQPASIISRSPTPDLLTLNSGELSCTVPGLINHPPVVQCPDGSVVIHRGAQVQTICVPGATFVVSVLQGSAQIIDKEGHSQPVSVGREFYFDFQKDAFEMAKANVSQLKSIFSRLAAESG
jgi:hypothetical protein